MLGVMVHPTRFRTAQHQAPIEENQGLSCFVIDLMTDDALSFEDLMEELIDVINDAGGK